MSCGAGERGPTEIGKTDKRAMIAAYEKATLSPGPTRALCYNFFSHFSSIAF